MDMMNDKAIIESMRRYIGDNPIAIWEIMERTSKYGVPHFYVLYRTYKDIHLPFPLEGNNRLSIHADDICKFHLAEQLGHPVEILSGSVERMRPLLPEDQILMSTVNDTELARGSSHFEDEWRKGYYAINSQVSSFLTSAHGTYGKCYDELLSHIASVEKDGKNDSTYATWKELQAMMDIVSPDIVLDWFLHDTATIQQYRHTSPFTHTLSIVSDKEAQEVLHHVVNNPGEFPPRPSYDEWLRRILEKGQWSEAMKKYIPDAALRL